MRTPSLDFYLLLFGIHPPGWSGRLLIERKERRIQPTPSTLVFQGAAVQTAPSCWES
jgi:hypothetical protein